MNYIFSMLFLIWVSCNNDQKIPEKKSDGHLSITGKSVIQPSDTIPNEEIISNISVLAQEFLDSLQNFDRKKYARIVLKQFTFCNCLFQGLARDSIFTNTDQSNGFLLLNSIIHTEAVVDTIKSLVKNYVQWIDRSSRGPTNARNYSLLCLDLYESKFLDSLVKKFDSEILQDD